MRKKILIGLALLVVILTFSAPILLDLTPNKYEKSIIKNTQGADEERALSAAENANYTDIFQIERFDGSTDPNDYLHPGTYLMYTFAHVIDTEVLGYYDARFEGLKGKPEDMEFSYEANVHAYEQMQIVYEPSNSIKALSPNGTTLFRNAEFTGPSRGMRFALAGDSGYTEIQPEELGLNFSNCFLVEMKLAYSETYAPTAAFFSDVYQIVIVDKRFSPVLLCVQSSGAVA